jgi:hypothetical protein
MEISVGGDEKRRAAVMHRLLGLVGCGVDNNLQKIQARIDKNATPAFIQRWRHEMYLLRRDGLGETVLMLGTYETETLECIAEEFAKRVDGPSYPHKWVSYGGEEWRTVAGEHHDAMFRDYLSVCGSGFSPAESTVHVMLDVYRALDLEPGSIHRMPQEEVLLMVKPVFMIASVSRSAVRLRNPPGIKGEPAAVHDEYKGFHLREEIVQYLSGFPDRVTPLKDFMFENRKTLPEVDFGYFLERTRSHTSLVEGAL